MTDKPMLSVERKVIEDILADAREPATDYMAARKVLRALLDKPACTTPSGNTCPGDGVGACKKCPTAQHQGEPVAEVEVVEGDSPHVHLYQDVRDGTKLYAEQPAPVALTVWYGSMPESNGKSNWTAILHRKGGAGSFIGALSDGITIDRSEYPDRVRYEADRMRHLIGELAVEPDILAYDEKLHSDYVKPEQAAPAAVVMPDVDELAQIIRKVDGSHTLGAGSLAEAILEEVARLKGMKP